MQQSVSVSDGGVHILCEFEALIVDAVIIISCKKIILFIYLIN